MAKFTSIESRLRQTGYFVVAGIDEAGRGPLAGPVVSAAVILKKGTKLPGLDDSKKLSKNTRERLFDQIIERAKDYSISIVSHKTIDEINILKSVQLANKLCVDHLASNPDLILIDGRDKQIIDIPFQTIIKGDSKVRCIAAASVLAKVTRDKIMEHYSKQYPRFEFEKHMGYGTRKHRKILTQYGACEIHRKTYNYKPA